MQLDRSVYDPDCRDCSRLAQFLDQVKSQHPSYFCKPVPPFGSARARLLVVGLAPGMHGANASGRPFTGDWCSDLLYGTLHAYGFAKNPRSLSRDDDQALIDCRLTNAVKCLPPQNKPLPEEVRECNAYLREELAALASGTAILALGTVAHQAVLRGLGLRLADHAFAHVAQHDLGGGLRLFDSYHCSRYNTNTRRLTTAMFEQVFAAINIHLGRPLPPGA